MVKRRKAKAKKKVSSSKLIAQKKREEAKIEKAGDALDDAQRALSLAERSLRELRGIVRKRQKRC